jgi:hypothetical protein
MLCEEYNMKEYLYNWLFHYNTYTKEWNAFPREEHSDYFNGKSKNVVSSESHMVCMQLAAAKEQLRIKDV